MFAHRTGVKPVHLGAAVHNKNTLQCLFFLGHSIETGYSLGCEMDTQNGVGLIPRYGTARLASSPHALLWLGVLLLLALDIGRSIYARYGYRRPAAAFSGAPLDQNFPWPPGSLHAADPDVGKRLYGRYCSSCHGLTGNGLGPAAGNMIPRPRDLRLGVMKYQTTERGCAPSDQDLLRVISEGLRASAMPRFDDLLSPAERLAVVEYVKSFAPQRYAQPRPLVVIPAEPQTSAAGIAEGMKLFQDSCAACHGQDGRGKGTQVDAARNTWGPRDLTAPWTWKATRSRQDLWLRITQGIDPGGMPAAQHLSTEQRWRIAQYVETLGGNHSTESDSHHRGLGQQTSAVGRGEYLVRTLTCTYCHTESVVPMNYNPNRYLAGGSLTRAYPDGAVVSPNITPDVETGIGTWSEAELYQALTHGRTPKRSLDLSFKQWFFFQFDAQDGQAIARFLRTVPKVRHRTPPPLRYGMVETSIARVLRLPLVSPKQLQIPVPTGPFAEENPGLLPWDWPQRLLKLLQLGVGLFLAGILCRQAVQTYRQGKPLVTRKNIRTALLWIITPALLLVLQNLYVFIPRDAMTKFMDEELWRPQVETQRVGDSNSQQQSTLDRGRYLYQVACLFCHQIDGAGGDRLSDPYAGGFQIRNISSHKTHGIGDFTDAQIERAVRSGISKEGTQLFWGFMPWDMFSNFDDADMRALIAYLRTLPPVDKPALPRVPPRADHPAEITWTIDMSRILSRIADRVLGHRPRR